MPRTRSNKKSEETLPSTSNDEATVTKARSKPRKENGGSAKSVKSAQLHSPIAAKAAKKRQKTSPRKKDSPVKMAKRLKMTERKRNASQENSLNAASPSRTGFIPFGYENPTQVKINEQGIEITMSVQGSQEETAHSSEDEEEFDYEDDREVSFKDTSQSECFSETEPEDEGEITDSNSESDADQSCQTPSKEKMDNNSLSPQERRLRLKKLDDEMQDRLREIRQLLCHEGMDSSLQEVDKIQENMRKCSQPSGKNVNFNLNSNANLDNKKLADKSRK